MKSLIEEVNEIKSARISKDAKKLALLKLGITPYEVSIILDTEVPDARTARTIRRTFTFGVEIECGVEHGAIRNASQVTQFEYNYEGYNHRDGHGYYKFVSDGSLTLDHAIECVSPVLKGANGKKSLENACNTLRIAGARVNKSCGLHVHIGADKLTDEQFANVFVNYAYLENLIDRFMSASRRKDNNQFCKSIRKYRGIYGCRTRRDVVNVLYGNRYHKVNPMSYDRHKTIEFRQHQGTTDFAKIFNWIQFCGKLVIWSMSNRLTEDVTRIADIPFLTAAEKRFFEGRIRHFDREMTDEERVRQLAEGYILTD